VLRPASACLSPAGQYERAEAKTKLDWRVERGMMTGGLIKRVSPAMHTYFEYVTSEYPRGQAARHAPGPVARVGSGQLWTPTVARRMLGRAGERAGLGAVKPYAFRTASKYGAREHE
jgi:hypothetical protein